MALPYFPFLVSFTFAIYLRPAESHFRRQIRTVKASTEEGDMSRLGTNMTHICSLLHSQHRYCPAPTACEPTLGVSSSSLLPPLLLHSLPQLDVDECARPVCVAILPQTRTCPCGDS